MLAQVLKIGAPNALLIAARNSGCSVSAVQFTSRGVRSWNTTGLLLGGQPGQHAWIAAQSLRLQLVQLADDLGDRQGRTGTLTNLTGLPASIDGTNTVP